MGCSRSEARTGVRWLRRCLVAGEFAFPSSVSVFSSLSGTPCLQVKLVHAGSVLSSRRLLRYYNICGGVQRIFIVGELYGLPSFLFGTELRSAYLKMRRGVPSSEMELHSLSETYLTCPAMAARISCVMLCHRRLRETGHDVFGRVPRQIVQAILHHLLEVDPREVECSVADITGDASAAWVGPYRPAYVLYRKPDLSYLREMAKRAK